MFSSSWGLKGEIAEQDEALFICVGQLSGRCRCVSLLWQAGQREGRAAQSQDFCGLFTEVHLNVIPQPNRRFLCFKRKTQINSADVLQCYFPESNHAKIITCVVMCLVRPTMSGPLLVGVPAV